MTFTNAKQKIPRCFKDKMKADREWNDFRGQKVVDCGDKMLYARKIRGAVLVARDKCAQFIRNANKP